MEPSYQFYPRRQNCICSVLFFCPASAQTDCRPRPRAHWRWNKIYILTRSGPWQAVTRHSLPLSIFMLTKCLTTISLLFYHLCCENWLSLPEYWSCLSCCLASLPTCQVFYLVSLFTKYLLNISILHTPTLPRCLLAVLVTSGILIAKHQHGS